MAAVTAVAAMTVQTARTAKSTITAMTVKSKNSVLKGNTGMTAVAASSYTAPAPPNPPHHLHVALQTHERRFSECSVSSVDSIDHDSTIPNSPAGPNLQTLLRGCNVLCSVFLCCSILSFNSSAYTGAGSALDAVLVMSDVVCIDVSSALFVLAGCAAGTLFTNCKSSQRSGLARIVAAALLLDMYIATCAALVLGGIHALTLARFRWRDVGFTALEGVSTLRALDFQQSPLAPHSYNVASWPAQSLLWCVLGTTGLQALNAHVVARLPALGDAVIVVFALLGIVLFTAFGSMQASSNIFYANACSVTYRSLEYNLGVHAVFLYGRHPPLVAALRRACQQARYFVALLVATVWVAEVGRPLPAPSAGPCLRLYFRNACLQAHHGFLLRGCGLALFLLLCAGTGPAEQLPREMRLSATLLSAVCFCWPVCIGVKLALDITFGAVLINQNRPVVLMITAAGLGVLACSYNTLVQPHLLAYVRQSVAAKRSATDAARDPARAFARDPEHGAEVHADEPDEPDEPYAAHEPAPPRAAAPSQATPHTSRA